MRNSLAQRSPCLNNNNYEVFRINIGQYNITNTRNSAGKTSLDNLSISRHIIFSMPVSASCQDTDMMLCRLVGFGGGPPFPCRDVWPGVVGVWEGAFRERTLTLVPSQLATAWPFSIAFSRICNGFCDDDFDCCWYWTSRTLTTTNSPEWIRNIRNQLDMLI